MADSPSADQIDAIVADPAWLPYRVRDAGRTLDLIYLPRDELAKLNFIDRRSQPARWETVGEGAPRLLMPVAAIADQARTLNSGHGHFIFHSAFCGSTLMSRALDIEGTACVLREPRVLHELALMKPGSSLPDEHRLALDVSLDLMQRSRLPGEKVIIKPANVANPLIEYIMERQPDSRALLMYLSLPDFIMAIARRRRWSWARNLAVFYRRHLEFETRQTQELLYLTDLQIAAFLWLQQQAQFARLVRELPEGRVATLRADVFAARATESIAAAAAFFGLSLDEDEAAAITAGPAFQKHSKRDAENYDESTRKRDEALVKFAFGPEIEQGTEWGQAIAADASIPLDLQAPLIR